MSAMHNVLGFPQALELVESLNLQPQVSVVGVCGFAGAGKTTLCNAIVEARPENVFRLDCDLFSASGLSDRQERIRRAVASGNKQQIDAEENPENWYDWQEICCALEALRQKRMFQTGRAWNRETGQLDAHYRLSLPPSGPVIVLCDCIFLLHEPVRACLDRVLLVRASDEVIARRRRERTKTLAADDQARVRHEMFERPYFLRHADAVDAVLL